jgi:surface carbohydrate biosynthesis protein (TIGR04326 family)
MKLIIVDKFDRENHNYTNEFDKVFVWNGTSINTSFYLFIEDHLNSRKNYFRSIFLNLVGGFSEGIVNGIKVNTLFKFSNGINLWDFSKFNELPYDQTKNLKKSFKLLALFDLLETYKVSLIHSQIEDIEINKLIKIFCINNDIDILNDQSSFKLNKVYNFFIDFKFIFKAIFKILHNTIICFIFSFHNKKCWKDFSAKLILFSYYSNSEKFINFNSKNYESRFWPKIHSLFDTNNLSHKWIHIYTKNNNLVEACKIILFLNNKKLRNKSHVFIHSFFKFHFVLNIFFYFSKSVCSYFLSKRVVFNDIKVLVIFKLLENEFRSSFIGTTAISNLFFYYNINLLKKSIGNTQIILYPYENQSWEKIMLFHFNIKTVGYAHSTIRFWDLRYYISINTSYVPKFIAVNGKISKNNLEHFVEDLDKFAILEVEALKYLDQIHKPILLSDIVSTRIEYNMSPNFLFLGDYINRISEEVFNILNSFYFLNKSPFTHSNFAFKNHPATKTLKLPFYFHDVSDIALNNSIHLYDIIITTSTSTSSLDAYMANKLVLIYYDESNLHLTDFHSEEEGLYFFKNLDELQNILLKYSYIKNISFNMRLIDNFFYTDTNLLFWNKALNKILIL